MFNYFNRGGRHRSEGAEVLRYRICLPSFPQKPRISKFYEDISDRVYSYCQSELCRYAEETYSLCDMPKKKFNYHPICYCLEGKVTYADIDVIFVRLTARSEHRGFGDSRRTVYDAHAWSPSEELLMPPKQAAAMFMKRRDFPKTLTGSAGFLVDGGKYYVCLGDRIEEAVAKKG